MDASKGAGDRSSPRWELTAEELSRVESGGRFGPLELAKAVARSPQVVGELVGGMVSGAVEGVTTSGSLRWVLSRERLRRVAPDAGGGANWGRVDSFCEPLLLKLDKEMRVLDLGCGAGRISQVVAPHVAHLTCADVSRVLLAEARENLADLPHVDFVQTSRYGLNPLADDSFDLVCAQGVLEFFDTIAAVAVLDGVRRVLRPGGMSYINFFTIDQPGGAEWALRSARATARSERIPGSSPKPYVNAQVSAMHALVGLNVVEVIRPETINRESTIFVAVRDDGSTDASPQA